MISELREDIDGWCAESNWLVRTPVLLLILHQAYQQIGLLRRTVFSAGLRYS